MCGWPIKKTALPICHQYLAAFMTIISIGHTCSSREFSLSFSGNKPTMSVTVGMDTFWPLYITKGD